MVLLGLVIQIIIHNDKSVRHAGPLLFSINSGLKLNNEIFKQGPLFYFPLLSCIYCCRQTVVV